MQLVSTEMMTCIKNKNTHLTTAAGAKVIEQAASLEGPGAIVDRALEQLVMREGGVRLCCGKRCQSSSSSNYKRGGRQHCLSACQKKVNTDAEGKRFVVEAGVAVFTWRLAAAGGAKQSIFG